MVNKQVTDVRQFFWDHMLKDLRLASRSLNLNIDEIITLLHRISNDILNDRTGKIIRHPCYSQVRTIFNYFYTKTF